MRRIDADMYCRSEPRANWGKTGHDCQLKNIFASETKLIAVKNSNAHKNTGRAQEGGTCTLMFNELETMVGSMDTEETNL